MKKKLQSFRISRKYICYFDGQQEELYVDRLKKLIGKNYHDVTIDFQKISNIYSLNRSSSSQNKIAFYDYDFEDDRFEEFGNLSHIRKIYCNVNFDLWLLMHKQPFNKIVSKNDAYVDDIIKAYNLEKGADIKKKKNIERIVNQIEIEDINFAINNAKSMMDAKNIKDIHTIGKFSYYDNPATNFHEFLEELFGDIKNNKK